MFYSTNSNNYNMAESVKIIRVKDDAVNKIETETFGEDFWASETNDILESTLQGASLKESLDSSEVYESAEEVGEEIRTRSGRQRRRQNYLNDYIMDLKKRKRVTFVMSRRSSRGKKINGT